MKCADLMPLLNQFPVCKELEDSAQFETHCLYPSSDPVRVYVEQLNAGYRVTDGGGALRSALIHGHNAQGYFDKACKRHAVKAKGGMVVAEFSSGEWLYPAILAVSNASAMIARLALEASVAKNENSLKDAIYESLKRAVPESKIGRNYEHMGRSGHLWPIDFVVREDGLILVKSVVQNGNSINSNYAAFGDIGDQREIAKFSVFDRELNQDSEALLRQVAALVPIKSLTPMVEKQAYRSRLS